jgi:hypothetical protein
VKDSASNTPHANDWLPAKLFRPYVDVLAALFETTTREGTKAHVVELNAALDGQPSRELRAVYSAELLRSTGTYFTGARLAEKLVQRLQYNLRNFPSVIDPACGAGDLLIACARSFPLQHDFAQTIRDWGRRLIGFDVNSSFVRATQYRLALLALARSGITNPSRALNLPSEAFPSIRTGSGLGDWELPSGPALVVVNPPFVYGTADPSCTWASGRVSLAASFMDRCLDNAPKGSRILAILPDVLRTGTHYERWRQMISNRAYIQSLTVGGKFDALTQVNVFLLELEVGGISRRRTFAWARPTAKPHKTVKDFFKVSVGTVVPFRLDGRGPWRHYANLEMLAPWKTVRRLPKHIRFKGTAHKTPFVTIRRTSKSDSPNRCVGTVVTSKGLVVVENHLLVALPQDRTVKTCRKLLRVLQADSTTDWMDKRICCRHLTVPSVQDIPWFEDKVD